MKRTRKHANGKIDYERAIDQTVDRDTVSAFYDQDERRKTDSTQLLPGESIVRQHNLRVHRFAVSKTEGSVFIARIDDSNRIGRIVPRGYNSKLRSGKAGLAYYSVQGTKEFLTGVVRSKRSRFCIHLIFKKYGSYLALLIFLFASVLMATINFLAPM